MFAYLSSSICLADPVPQLLPRTVIFNYSSSIFIGNLEHGSISGFTICNHRTPDISHHSFLPPSPFPGLHGSTVFAAGRINQHVPKTLEKVCKPSRAGMTYCHSEESIERRAGGPLPKNNPPSSSQVFIVFPPISVAHVYPSFRPDI